EDGLLVFGDDFDGAQSPALRPVLLRETGQCVEHLEIPLDDLAHARAQHLDDHFLAARQAGRMHLRDGGRRERNLIESLEYLAERASVSVLDNRTSHVPRKGWDLILELCELIGDIGGQQVAPRGDRLAELHENRAELRQREPQARGPARPSAAHAPDTGREQHEQSQRAIQVRGVDEIVETVFEEQALDLKEPREDADSHGARFSRRAGASCFSSSAIRSSIRSTRARASSTPSSSCRPSARETRSPRSWAKYSAKLRTVVSAALRHQPNAAVAKRAIWCAGTSPIARASSSSRSGRRSIASSR